MERGENGKNSSGARRGIVRKARERERERRSDPA